MVIPNKKYYNDECIDVKNKNYIKTFLQYNNTVFIVILKNY